MGFPVGYSELPTLVLHVIFLMDHVRRLVFWAFDAVGLGDLLDSDAPWPDSAADLRPDHRQRRRAEIQQVPAAVVDEALPVVRFETLRRRRGGGSPPESCAVCLQDLEAREEVRRQSNCRGHVFHRRCLDRWIGHGHRTCPLCRAPLFPEESPAAAAAAAEWSYHDEMYSLLPPSIQIPSF